MQSASARRTGVVRARFSRGARQCFADDASARTVFRKIAVVSIQLITIALRLFFRKARIIIVAAPEEKISTRLLFERARRRRNFTTGRVRHELWVFGRNTVKTVPVPLCKNVCEQRIKRRLLINYCGSGTSVRRQCTRCITSPRVVEECCSSSSEPLVSGGADVASAAVVTTTTSSRRHHEMQLAARRMRWMCLLCACALADQRVVNSTDNGTAAVQTGTSLVKICPFPPEHNRFFYTIGQKDRACVSAVFVKSTTKTMVKA